MVRVATATVVREDACLLLEREICTEEERVAFGVEEAENAQLEATWVAAVTEATTRWVRLMELEEGAIATVIEEEEGSGGKQSSRGGAEGGVARCNRIGRGRGALGRGVRRSP
ncbi:hypothetical protein BHE74_00046237 [Ensete ventricosum]|nr:hypothetical protein BHE74_00046237 [Ensete ventricosum]